jgi:hypothetical protein
MRWKFSHLKNKLIFGAAGVWPSQGVPTSAEADCGVLARFVSVVLVCTGVWCMWGWIRVWAACTEGRVRGVEEDAMVGMEGYEGNEETFYNSYLAVLSTCIASIP